MSKTKQNLSPTLQLAFADGAEDRKVFLPTDRFCVRQTSALFFGGKYWIYADVIPWDHPFWPDTYDTTIHLFSSVDGRKYVHHGDVVFHGAPGSWDAGGVATPGAVVHDGQIYLFYSGRENADGTGTRSIGLAVASFPEGPFQKRAEPVLTSEGHLDDPCPILSADGRGVDLYFRQAMRHLPPPNYSVCLTRSVDHGCTWSESVPVLSADENLRACETAEVTRIENQVLMATFDHLAQGNFKTALRLSEDGMHFTDCTDVYLDDCLCKDWDIPSCMLQIVLIPDADGVNRHFGITEVVDDIGHYNLAIYEIEFARQS